MCVSRGDYRWNCCRFRFRICTSFFAYLILTGVLCAISTSLMLLFSPWSIPTSFKQLTSPVRVGASKPSTSNHPKTKVSGEIGNKIPKWSKLEDTNHLYVGDESVSNIYKHTETRAMLKILWVNRPSWFAEEEICHKRINSCYFNNCAITYNNSLIEEANAVIFDATDITFPHNPPLLPLKGRIYNQIWIFYGLESPIHYHNNQFRNLEWRMMFNWTMTYRLDSDIPIPYGMLVTNPNPPARYYSEIYHAKTKFAAWIVSNCNANSKRDNYVRLLQNYIPVDIFGTCGMRSCSRTGPECLGDIGKNYKFYLSFENSLCKDYITEKFFKYFSLDLITVRRGYSHYKLLLPHDIYIDTDNFSTVQELAMFLKTLAADEDRYMLYLKSKDRYLSKNHTAMYCTGLCNICEKLNNLEKYKRLYDDIASWLENNTCSAADDIR